MTTTLSMLSTILRATRTRLINRGVELWTNSPREEVHLGCRTGLMVMRDICGEYYGELNAAANELCRSLMPLLDRLLPNNPLNPDTGEPMKTSEWEVQPGRVFSEVIDLFDRAIAEMERLETQHLTH